MALPAIEAERWRLVEQKLAEYGVDIQRLWRQVQQTQVGGYAQSGALTPDELAALAAAGSGGGGSGDSVRVYTLAIRGNADSGTIPWAFADGATTGTGTFNYDDEAADVVSALSSLDSGVQAVGGELRFNVIKIKFSDSTQRLSITGNSLVRESYGVTPVPELAYCDEPVGWWE